MYILPRDNDINSRYGNHGFGYYIWRFSIYWVRRTPPQSRTREVIASPDIFDRGNRQHYVFWKGRIWLRSDNVQNTLVRMIQQPLPQLYVKILNSPVVLTEVLAEIWNDLYQAFLLELQSIHAPISKAQTRSPPLFNQRDYTPTLYVFIQRWARLPSPFCDWNISFSCTDLTSYICCLTLAEYAFCSVYRRVQCAVHMQLSLVADAHVYSLFQFYHLYNALQIFNSTRISPVKTYRTKIITGLHTTEEN